LLALAALILVALLTACDSAEPTTAQQARPTDSARIATRLDPSVYLAGAGDPEDFLYRGVRQPDGTRAGDQDEIIDALARQGVNAIYFQMIRSHGGDGDDDHNPFLNNDPNSGLNPNVLDQWERWFLKLESSGINILLFFYDDSASVWRSGDELAEGEGEFIRAVVRRFGNLDNIIWVVAEEYSEALSAKKVSAIAKEISLADPIRRPVAVHKLSGTMFAEFASDPEIGVFAMQLPELSAAEINSAVSEAWSRSFGRYDLIMSEAPSWGTGLEAQRKAWASAFGGAHVLVYDLAFASPDAHELGYLRHLRDFAERFVLLDAVPNTRIVEQGSLFAMKSLDGKHFVYGRGTLGLSGIRPGDYDLLLFDPQTGGSVSTSVRIAGADWSYDVGDEFPSDVVAVLDPKQAKLARFPAARWNAPDPDGAGPGHQLLETSAEKIGGAGCVVNDGRMAFQWGDIGARREWASAAKPILAMLVGLAIQEGLIESIDSGDYDEARKWMVPPGSEATDAEFEAFRDYDEMRAKADYKRGAAVVEFSIEREGNSEDIMRGQGGSVANILSVGLRMFALSTLDETDHRRFLVLDEQDCWLRPDIVPRLVKIVHEAAHGLGFQVLMISHHDIALFERYADRIYQLSLDREGEVQAKLHESAPEVSDEDSH